MITVKSIINRSEEPTTKTLFCSKDTINIIDKFTGEFLGKKSIVVEDFNSSLKETIEEVKNNLVRQGLRPVRFIVINHELKKEFDNYDQVTFKPFITPFEATQKISFEDAEPFGKLGITDVFVSAEIPENLILLGVSGNGLYYTKTKNGIDIEISNEPYFQKGNVAFWGFIKIV